MGTGKLLPPSPMGLMGHDPAFANAWEYLPADAKKALAAWLPKITQSGVGGQVREAIRNAVVAAGTLYEHGSDAYEDKHGQVNLFSGSAGTRRPPSKHAIHIAERLMGADAKSLGVCLGRLEKVVYAYNTNDHKHFPTNRILDQTIEWAFAIRIRKPKPFAGAWLISQRNTDAPAVAWDEVQGAFKACSLWPEGCDLPWYEWCWKLMTEVGLTEFQDEAEHDLVRLRAVALQHIYADYCLIVFTERPSWNGERLYVALGGQRLAWDRSAFLAQRTDVAGAILGHYKRLDTAMRNKGRLQFEGGATEAILEDLEAALPLMAPTLKEHFKGRATWLDKPNGPGRRALDHSPYEERRKVLIAWMMRAMRALAITTTEKRVKPKR